MRLPAPLVTENTVVQIVGGPRDGWWKWTIGFAGDYTDPDLMSLTPTPNFPIGVMLAQQPDAEDEVLFGGGAVTTPLGVEGAYRPWKPSGISGNNVFGSSILWRTETIVDGGDSDSPDAVQRDGSGMLPYTLLLAGYDEPPVLNWDVSSVVPSAITVIGDELFFPPEAMPGLDMPNGWFMCARQYTMDGNNALWSKITNVNVHLRAGTGESTTTYSDFMGGPLVNDPAASIGPRDVTKLFNTLGVWQGPDLASLSEIGSSGNASKDGGVTFDAVEGETYYIQVGGGLPGINGSAVLTWE